MFASAGPNGVISAGKSKFLNIETAGREAFNAADTLWGNIDEIF